MSSMSAVEPLKIISEKWLMAVNGTASRNRKRTLSDEHLLISDLEPVKVGTLSNFINIVENAKLLDLESSVG